MTPMLFGPASRQLFGLYHAPERNGDIAVLICAPFGQEAIRAHRLFRVLADRLARSGAAVLRFDYYGSGDSPGDDTDASSKAGAVTSRPRTKNCAAAQAAGASSGSGPAWRGGGRDGGKERRCDPSRLILWDPVVDGSRYMEELRAGHVDALERSYCVPDPAWRQRLSKDSDAFTDEVFGFGVSPVLRRQLRALAPETLQLTPLHETVVLADAEDRAAQQWAKQEAARNIPLRASQFQHPLIWTSDPHPNNAMVPTEALQRLLAEANE